MPQGMNQFLQVFFEETEEHLATLELPLVDPNLDRPDSETLHGIFRAAHSIKGSSRMFGFDDITSVTHKLEALLDHIHCGQMGLQPDVVSSFLEARDVLQRLLDAHCSGHPDPGVPLLEMAERLRGWLRAPEQKAAEEGFSLFNDAPTNPAREAANDDAFGFFDEDPGAPERAAAPEASGLFDEVLGTPAASKAFDLFDDAPGSPPTEERAFGLFGGAPDNLAAPSAPAQAVATPTRGAVAPVRGDGKSGSIRVSVEGIDNLINLIDELVITQAMLGRLGEQLGPSHHKRLQHALAQLGHNTRDLQESVMLIRVLPINFISSRFPRLMRNIVTRLGKQVELRLHGEHTGLDKSVIEKLSDSLTYIVRNSIDHGIETPAEHPAAGRPASGAMKLATSHQDGNVVVEVLDDGRGLSRPCILAKARERNLPVHDGMSDAEVWQLVFMPGFSTIETVTELSGRGVGMDVVKRNIGVMGGHISIDSTSGIGTHIDIRLPLTLATLDDLVVAVEAINYVIPLTYIAESLQARSDNVRGLGGEGNVMIHVRGKCLLLFNLHELLRIGDEAPASEQGIVVILEPEERSFALRVDELVGQQQVMTKSLEQSFHRVEGIAGATIMGNDSVALILDVNTLPRLAAREDIADERR